MTGPTPTPLFSASEQSVRPVPADQPKPGGDRNAAREAGRKKKEQEAALRKQQEELLERFASRAGRERDLVDGSVEYKLVPIDDLVPDPSQPRKVLRNVAELAATIASEGLLQPVTARVGEKGDRKLYLIYGHRRLAAMRLLHWTYAPTMIRLKPSTKSPLVQQLLENFHQQKMDLMDQALALRELMREEKIATYDKCAERIGKSLTFVTQRIALLDLDEKDQKRVINGELSLAEGASIARRRVGNTRNRTPKPVTTSTGFGGADAARDIRTGFSRDPNVKGQYAPPDTSIITTRGHFTEAHYLAARARSRCRAQTQVEPTMHKPLLGAVACGPCWEVVIRSDARVNPDIIYREHM